MGPNITSYLHDFLWLIAKTERLLVIIEHCTTCVLTALCQYGVSPSNKNAYCLSGQFVQNSGMVEYVINFYLGIHFIQIMLSVILVRFPNFNIFLCFAIFFMKSWDF
jgi:hypothetical protein